MENTKLWFDRFSPDENSMTIFMLFSLGNIQAKFNLGMYLNCQIGQGPLITDGQNRSKCTRPLVVLAKILKIVKMSKQNF